MRRFLRLLEVVNDRLRVCIVADNTLCKCTTVFGVQLIKPLQNELRVALVLGEDDGFTQSVTASNTDAALHQILKHRVNGCLVENEFVQLCRRNEVRHQTVLNKVLFIPFLVLIGKVVVCDTFL